ncbi:MAG: hypothetical protein QXK18_07820 [Candidatus Bathyarchaeia archaeon]
MTSKPYFSKMSAEEVVDYYKNILGEDVVLSVKNYVDGLLLLHKRFSEPVDDEFRMSDYFIPWEYFCKERERRDLILSLGSLLEELKKHYSVCKVSSPEDVELWKRIFYLGNYCTVEEAERRLIDNGFDPHSEEDVRRLEKLVAEVKEAEKVDPDYWMRTGGYFPLEPILPEVDESVLEKLNIPRGYIVHDILVSRIKRKRYADAGERDLAKKEEEREENLLKIYSAIVSRRRSPGEAVKEVMEIKRMSLEQMMDEAADMVAKEFLVSIYKNVKLFEEKYPIFLANILNALASMKNENFTVFQKEIGLYKRLPSSLADVPMTIGRQEPFRGNFERFYDVFICPISWSEILEKDAEKLCFWRKVASKAVKHLFGVEAEPFEPCVADDISGHGALEPKEKETLEGILERFPEIKKIQKYVEGRKISDFNVVEGVKSKITLYFEILAKYLNTVSSKERERLFHLERRCFPTCYVHNPTSIDRFNGQKLLGKLKCFILENGYKLGYDYDEKTDTATLSYFIKNLTHDEVLKELERNRKFGWQVYWSKSEKILFFCEIDEKTFEAKVVEVKRVIFP